MNIRPGQNYHKPDTILIVIIIAITVFGLISLLSASGPLGYARFGDAYFYLKGQLLGLVLGLIGFFYFSRTDYRRWKKYAFALLVFSILLLTLVFIPGLKAGYGLSRSWINVLGYSFQPAELVKLCFLLYLAAWLESRKEHLKTIAQGTGPFLIVLGIIAVLMMLQPDFGTLSIIGAVSLIVYYVGGGSFRHILAIMLLSAAAFALMLWSNPYQQDRFRCLNDPEFSRDNICYQVNQSLIAVGSGGLFGRGLGESRQKYMYVPEVVGDSIFAIIAEETGLIVSAGLVALYLGLFYRGYLIARHAADEFGRILAIGIASWIAIQAFINIGGIINIMPMTGVPLPLVSHGGSSLLAALSALGILVNISRQTKTS